VAKRLGFLKTTLVGGVVFLVPFIVLVFILGKALAVMRHVAEPLSRLAPVQSVGAFATVDLLAGLLIVAICFLAGLAARTRAAGRAAEAVESRFLDHIPVYAFIKGITAGAAGDRDEGALTPVLARFDDCWRMAFEVERRDAGAVVVYLPGAPTPWSGSVCILTEDRVQRLDATMLDAVQTIRHVGRGSMTLLGGRVPAGRPLGR
jgi:uncharacterized membrane protein